MSECILSIDCRFIGGISGKAAGVGNMDFLSTRVRTIVLRKVVGWVLLVDGLAYVSRSLSQTTPDTYEYAHMEFA